MINEVANFLDTVETNEKVTKYCKFSYVFLCKLCSHTRVQFKQKHMFKVQTKEKSGQIRYLLEIPTVIPASN